MPRYGSLMVACWLCGHTLIPLLEGHINASLNLHHPISHGLRLNRSAAFSQAHLNIFALVVFIA